MPSVRQRARSWLASWSGVLLTIFSIVVGATHPSYAQSVLTFHNDTLRTGWNSKETALTAAAVGGGQFQLQAIVSLDQQVDTQVLAVRMKLFPKQSGPYVIYLATANNTLYALDGASGATLASTNFGPPVPQSALPGQCWNNAPSVGVDSTPVISPSARAIYIIAHTFVNNTPVLTLHELSLSTLQDLVPPVVVTATGTLSDGSMSSFNPAVQRQRSALLLSGSNVYAGFASFCDIQSNLSRGWVLGWNAGTLAPLAANQLNNKQAASPNSFFLSSVWMSGSGLATTGSNQSIFFTTGNSDYSGTSYSPKYNLSESLVKLAPDLSRVQGHFTPSDVAYLDQDDLDLGSGAVMLLPKQAGLDPSLLVTGGKDGTLYLFDRTHMSQPLSSYQEGECWCGPAYFLGADGQPRIVTSGGSALTSWILQTSPSAPPTLAKEFAFPLASGQDPGFLLSVSSNAEQPGSAVIWGVGRPTDNNPADVTLYAVDPVAGSVIYSATAGTWPNTGGNANIAPTVVGGRVYVASNAQLAIFGLGSPPHATAAAAIPAASKSPHLLQLQPGQHAISGTVTAMSHETLTLKTRDGSLLQVNYAEASHNSQIAVPVTGNAMQVVGHYAPGVLVAHSMQRIKSSPALWPLDQ